MSKTSYLFKSFKDFKIYRDNIDPKDIVDEINLLEIEDIRFLYSSGDRAEMVSMDKVYNKYSYNYFSLYNKQMYLAFKSVQKLFIDAAKEKDINISRAYYYISSDYENDLDPNFWYDMGGVKIPCFSGYYFLDLEKDTKLYVSENEIDISKGDIVLFESGRKIRISNKNAKMITFSIVPLQFIKYQYPQKWMPIGTEQ
jgi:hypothetical protein